VLARQRIRGHEGFVLPIREYAPLCLSEGLRRGKAIEVGRGSHAAQHSSAALAWTQMWGRGGAIDQRFTGFP